MMKLAVYSKTRRTCWCCPLEFSMPCFSFTADSGSKPLSCANGCVLRVVDVGFDHGRVPCATRRVVLGHSRNAAVRVLSAPLSANTSTPVLIDIRLRSPAVGTMFFCCYPFDVSFICFTLSVLDN